MRKRVVKMLNDATAQVYREASNYAHYCVIKLRLANTELGDALAQEKEAVLNARISNLSRGVKEATFLASRLVEWADRSLELQSELTSSTLSAATALVDEMDGVIADTRSIYTTISRKSLVLKENKTIGDSLNFAHTNVIYLANMFKDATIDY